ncbi:MAG: class I SAM-dependent methyltransferase [Pirellulales bacterium]
MSLPRVLEVEYMDTATEAVEYDSMDHSHVNRIFVDDLLACDNPPTEILDLGTGTARIPIELCRRLEDCRVMAVDAASHMLELAHYNIEMAGLGERIQLARADAKRLPYPDGMFSAVVSNSIVHHIPEPLEVLREAVRVTASGGLLFFRDLLRPADASELAALVSRYAGNESESAQRLFADSLHAALTLEEVRDMVESLGFSRESVRATSDRHWTFQANKS